MKTIFLDEPYFFFCLMVALITGGAIVWLVMYMSGYRKTEEATYFLTAKDTTVDNSEKAHLVFLAPTLALARMVREHFIDGSPRPIHEFHTGSPGDWNKMITSSQLEAGKALYQYCAGRRVHMVIFRSPRKLEDRKLSREWADMMERIQHQISINRSITFEFIDLP